MTNSRGAVLKLLMRVYKDNAYSNIVLDKYFSETEIPAQDKKFISALFYGVIERRITLDAVIDKYSKTKLAKLDSDVLVILRMGIYQLLYMDSVPQSAAVNESVKLAKKSKNPALSGFVNGVLRSFIRDGMKLPEGKTQIQKLSVNYSCPEWLVGKWLSEYGEQAALSLLEASIGKTPITVRVNTVKTTVNEVVEVLKNDGVSIEKTMLENCLSLKCSGSVENLTAYKDGLIHVQDISSQLCCMALGAKSGETVIDLCSAPGGKAFTIAQLMENSGRLLAFDIHQNRVKLIQHGAERLGLTIIEAGQNDASAYNEGIPQADRVLCDVPCSGLGVIGKKPEIKYKSESEIEKLPEIQIKIVNAASRYVKPGGTLVYSTCTVSRAENDSVADKFLRGNPDFEGVPVLPEISQLSGSKATIIPRYFNSDGFFIAKFKRNI